jgi:hypothetical protein
MADSSILMPIRTGACRGQRGAIYIFPQHEFPATKMTEAGRYHNSAANPVLS